MLAQNFKNASELKISEQQRDALIKTLVFLETGKIKHFPDFENTWTISHHVRARLSPDLFNMSCWKMQTNCGTICCIGGTAEIIGDVQFRHNPLDRTPLGKLFYPNINQDRYSQITIEQAARALRSYLTNGNANWASVLGQSL